MSLIVPAVVFLIAVAMAAIAGIRMAPPIATSAWLMPLIVTVAMAVVAAVIFINEVVQRTSAAWAAAGVSAEPPRSTPARVAGWLALSAGYAVLTPIVGFEWATAGFLVLALKTFGGASWRVALPVAAAIALILPFVFRRFFFTIVP